MRSTTVVRWLLARAEPRTGAPGTALLYSCLPLRRPCALLAFASAQADVPVAGASSAAPVNDERIALRFHQKFFFSPPCGVSALCLAVSGQAGSAPWLRQEGYHAHAAYKLFAACRAVASVA